PIRHRPGTRGNHRGPKTFRKESPFQRLGDLRRSFVQPWNADNPPLRSGLSTFLFLLAMLVISDGGGKLPPERRQHQPAGRNRKEEGGSFRSRKWKSLHSSL